MREGAKEGGQTGGRSRRKPSWLFGESSSWTLGARPCALCRSRRKAVKMWKQLVGNHSCCITQSENAMKDRCSTSPSLMFPAVTNYS